MDIAGISAVVTGGASGLGLATARRLVKGGANVVMLDLASSAGAEVAAELGGGTRFVAGDVAHRGGRERPRWSRPGSSGRCARSCTARAAGTPCGWWSATVRRARWRTTRAIIKLNLIGSFNVLRLAAAQMARTEAVDGERGAIVLTASVAAYEGQIGQIPYASSKAGIVGMTLVAARDLATKLIRVATIAPGMFDTPLLGRLPQEVRDSLGATVPHPSRLGAPDEFGALAVHILENPMLNGETIRLDGAIRMAPR